MNYGMTASMATSGAVGHQDRPETTMESAASAVHNALANLGNSLDTLSHRMGGVLSPPVPQPAAANGKLATVDTPHSPVVNDLYAMAARAQQLDALVIDLNARLEA